MNSEKFTFATMKPAFWFGGALVGTVLLILAGQAAAQEEEGGGRSSASVLMEEVTITARKREERLLDQPSSIAAITADAMQVQGIYNINDASRYVPNVTLATAERANNTRVVIRGIGGGFPDPVFVFGSGMYIDGHYIPTSLGGYMSTVDIERIELLRGPQGTLFGKNVTGGAVNIISTKPHDQFDSSIKVRMGEDGEQSIRGMVNVPISDKVFGRFSVVEEEFDGYYYNRNLNRDVGGSDTQGWRAAFRFVPNENWTIDATIGRAKKRDDQAGQCIGQGPLGDAPQWGGGTGNLERRLYTGAAQDFFDICAADMAAGDFVNSSDKFTFSAVDEENLNLAVEWQSLGPVIGLEEMTIKAKYSDRKMEYKYLADRDYTSMPIDTIGTLGPLGQHNESTGFEIVMEATVNDQLRFTLGANLFEEDARNGDNGCYELFVANPDAALEVGGITVTCTPQAGLLFELVPDNPTGTGLWPDGPRLNPNGPAPFLGEVTVHNESTGIFGHVTYDFNDDWTLDFGIRWTEDDREFNNIEFAILDCDISIDPNNLCQVTLDLNWATVIDGGFFNRAEDTFTAVTPMVSLTRNLEGGDTLHSGMVYALYSEGFLTGGFNSEINSNLPDTAPFLSYDPEKVQNYELGFKGQFMDGNVQLMADIFYMDYTDQQRQLEINNSLFLFGNDDPIQLFQNVASSSIVGLELEFRASLWEGGFVSADLGYLVNEYDEYEYQDPTDPTSIVDLSDVLIADFTPDWTLNLAVEHEFRLGNGATIAARTSMYWQSEFEWAALTDGWPENGPDSSCMQDAYTKFDGRVTYRPANGDWQLAAFGGNLTDERIIESCVTTRSVWIQRLERPRWFGLEFTMHFSGI